MPPISENTPATANKPANKPATKHNDLTPFMAAISLDDSPPTMSSTVEQFKQTGMPKNWELRNFKQIQSLYPLEQKGWLVKVDWHQASIPGAGYGVFADEFIPSGTVMRVGRRGINFCVFDGEDDLPKEIDDDTLTYLSWYIFGTEQRCGCFVPGCSYNHSNTNDNMMVRWHNRDEMHVFATKDICAGDELLANYASYGPPPQWLSEWAKKQNIDICYKGGNDYVE